jgi:hypothetical protein
LRWPGDTYCRCCFILCGELYSAEEVVVANAAITRALALRLVFLLIEMFYCSLQLCLSCSSLFDLLLHGLSSFRHCLSPGQLFLHESQVLILLMEACQLVFDDCFDLLFRILLLILLSFGLLVMQWWLSAWPGGVDGRGGGPPRGL